jgi:tRNA 2-thiouridine synthesizing protein A
MAPTIDRELDVRGLSCPLPILRMKKALAELESGQYLRVLATDPGARKDFAAFARHSGNLLVHSGDEGGYLVFVIQRK